MQLSNDPSPTTIRKMLRWDAPGSIGPCLGIPFPDASGQYNGYARLKPDNPRCDKQGKSVRYESPRGKPIWPTSPTA